VGSDERVEEGERLGFEGSDGSWRLGRDGEGRDEGDALDDLREAEGEGGT
jgi:hypothetical protein